MKTMKARPDYLRIMPATADRAIGVDREKRIIRGRVIAQLGPFKSEGRGEFDLTSLKQIVSLMQKREPGGTRARWTHPSLSSDGLGTFLGRDHNARLDTAYALRDDGSKVKVDAVRSDLHLDPTAFDTPEKGDLASYLMDLVESDPDALSSSLVVKIKEEQRLDAKNRPLLDEKGDMLPPLWRVLSVHGVDVVDTGDAVDGFLSAHPDIDPDSLPDALVRRGTEMLDRLFHGQPWEVVEARVLAWLGRYRELRYGDSPQKLELPTPTDGEAQKDFMDRCMANPTATDEFPEADQRRAVCQKQWEDAHGADMQPTPVLDAYRLRLEDISHRTRQSARPR